MDIITLLLELKDWRDHNQLYVIRRHHSNLLASPKGVSKKAFYSTSLERLVDRKRKTAILQNA